ncbi:DUF6165 family protein [Inquilinus sp. NPDC058860]|uniref:DUF6165 family protein n=1 Tax=Inquilinus sp. NPDC058860 TaxID=3346652 RepID=UPI0036A576B3
MLDEHVVIPVSIGEVFDKITILEIKLRHARSESARRNIELEHSLLKQTLVRLGLTSNSDLTESANSLLRVNQALWNVEDELRELERKQDFGAEFVRLARSVYVLNDERAAIKRRINIASGSTIIEEKLYADYRRD